MKVFFERVLFAFGVIIIVLIACLGGWAVSHYPHIWWPTVLQWVWIVLGIISGIVILLIEMVIIIAGMILTSGPEYDEYYPPPN